MMPATRWWDRRETAICWARKSSNALRPRVFFSQTADNPIHAFLQQSDVSVWDEMKKGLFFPSTGKSDASSLTLSIDGLTSLAWTDGGASTEVSGQCC